MDWARKKIADSLHGMGLGAMQLVIIEVIYVTVLS